ncbi:coiled-coil domain-containing protein 112 isoform X1 [Entelurus aequoreus]|uniref:coiled-coil domain-containing protein 112 isoform X1 n=1 Tax=Entelurus aequoreus TaxID=161455 RepID=UPI002B1D683D|nr:coiled-coil domain-containing protein 112 isoform X1 [Entelurus aequoreus]
MASLATVHQLPSSDSEPPPSLPDDQDCVDERQSRRRAKEFLKEAEKTRILVDKLERERPVQCRKSRWTDVATELDEYEKTLVEERSAQKVHLKKQLVRIQNGVREFKQQLANIKPTPNLIEKLKEIMSQVEISISHLKEEQRSCFGELLKEERTCNQEVAAYEKKIENWSITMTSDSKPSTVTTSKALVRDLPLEVRALEAFLQKTGGVYGSWEGYDHQAFLKVWTKHGGQASFRKEAKVFLPGKSQEEIEEHERWLLELIHLQDKRREAIQRWRSKKELERQSRIQKQAETVDAERKKKDVKNQQSKSEEEKKLAAQSLERWKEAKTRKEEQEKQRRAALIQKNRTAKVECRHQLEAKMTSEEQVEGRRGEEEEEEEEKIRRAEEEKIRRAGEEKIRRAKEERIRRAEEDKIRRAEEDKIRKEQEEREMERRKEATKSIKHLIKRDLDRVQAKRQEKLQKQKEEEERQERIMMKLKEKVDCHVSRDPSRLVKPTKGWEERIKSV